MGIFLFYKEKWWRKEMGYKEDFHSGPHYFILSNVWKEKGWEIGMRQKACDVINIPCRLYVPQKEINLLII
jgi:hypothetical protein